MGIFNYEVGMYSLICISCGIAFAIPIDFREKRQGDHKTFYCPNGHEHHYPQETEEEKLERVLSYTKNRLNNCQIHSKELDYRARYYKGRITILQKNKEG